MIDLDAIYMLAERAKELPIYPDPRFPPSLYYRFLRALCEYIQPECCVELGVCGGGGSLHMCIGTPGIVVGVDIVNDYPDQIAYIESHFSNFVFWQMDSVEAAEYSYCGMSSVNVLFIDTLHTYEQTMAEFRAWEPLLADDAVICLDDLNRDGVDEAWAEIPGQKVRIDWLHPAQSPIDGGFGVIWK